MPYSKSIRLFPDNSLRQKCAKVERFDQELRRIVSQLGKIMESQPHGIGIAAPQIGVLRQIAIVDVRCRIPGAARLILINPLIVDAQEPRRSREGCMSMPDYTADLIRHDRIRFRAQNLYGDWYECVSRGIEAVCVQHEVDHLQGILFFDRVASLKTDMFPRSKKKSSSRQAR